MHCSAENGNLNCAQYIHSMNAHQAVEPEGENLGEQVGPEQKNLLDEHRKFDRNFSSIIEDAKKLCRGFAATDTGIDMRELDNFRESVKRMLDIDSLQETAENLNSRQFDAIVGVYKALCKHREIELVQCELGVYLDEGADAEDKEVAKARDGATFSNEELSRQYATMTRNANLAWIDIHMAIIELVASSFKHEA
jgi:hypothetical protein